MQNILTPTHPRWNEFCSRLADSIDMTETSNSWHCSHDHRHARSVMEAMGDNIDIDATLDFCQMHGGYCDCV